MSKEGAVFGGALGFLQWSYDRIIALKIASKFGWMDILQAILMTIVCALAGAFVKQVYDIFLKDRVSKFFKYKKADKESVD